MKDPKKKRDVRIEFVVSEQEAELIQEHMAELGCCVPILFHYRGCF